MSELTVEQVHQRITDAAKTPVTEIRRITTIAIGEALRQGDIYIIRIDKKPEHYTTETPNRQLAPGDSQGSRHIITEGPKVFETTERWNTNRLMGPVIVASDTFTLTHPEHAHFEIPAGTYQVRFQGEWAKEMRRTQD